VSDCQYAGCPNPKSYGHGRYYCHEHECNYDTCYRVVHVDGRCRGHAYCAVEGCNKMRRQVQRTPYCEEHATCINYELRSTAKRLEVSGSCVACCRPVTVSLPRTASRRLLLCDSHRHLYGKLKRWRSTYNLTDEQITGLLTDPTCRFCRRNLAWRLASFGPPGRAEKVHVDHDHACPNGCSGEGSCGSCVRGLACDECNRRWGVVEVFANDIGDDRLIELLMQRKAERQPPPPRIMQDHA
jgi:hypothetical protein